MSMYKTTYTIIGYDLQQFRSQVLPDKDILYDEKFEEWHCFKYPGRTQLFYDNCSGSHLYFGHILGSFGEEEDTSISISVENNLFDYYYDVIITNFVDMLSSNPDVKDDIPYILLDELKVQLIIFTELS